MCTDKLIVDWFKALWLEYPLKKKVQVGKDQEKAQSEKDSHSKNRGGKKQTNNQVLAGLNRFYRRLTSPSASAVVHNI